MLTTFLWIYLLYLFIYSNIAKGSTRGERRGKVQISAIWNKGIIRNLTNKIIKFERPKNGEEKRLCYIFNAPLFQFTLKSQNYLSNPL